MSLETTDGVPVPLGYEVLAAGQTTENSDASLSTCHCHTRITRRQQLMRSRCLRDLSRASELAVVAGPDALRPVLVAMRVDRLPEVGILLVGRLM